MKILGLWDRVAIRARISVSVSCPRAGTTATGLVPFAFTIQPGPGGRPDEYVLSAALSDRQKPVFYTTIPGGPVTTAWVALNSHCLPNGPAKIVFTLANSAGEALWKTSLRLEIANRGALAEKVRESVRRFHTPVFVDECNSTHYDYGDPAVRPWFDRPDALQHIQERLAKKEISAEEAASLEDFVRDGYIMKPDLLAPALVARIHAEMDDAVARRIEGYEFGSSQRLHQLHERYPGIRQLWSHPEILRLLEIIFEEKPRPCQSLTYIFGSQQSAHQDTIHLTPFPAGYMCGVWTAIEDVRPGSGELEVFKGSHRLPRLYRAHVDCSRVSGGNWSEFARKVPPVWERWVAEHGFERVVYRPNKGAVLIWHENLMHGGSVRLDPSLSRRSVVTHNFADGAIAYYDSSGLVGHMEPVENLPR